MKRIAFTLILYFLFLIQPSPVLAQPASPSSPRVEAGQGGPAIGIHLLDPNELEQAADLAQGSADHPGAVTVVLRADDLNLRKWQKFFDEAAKHNIIPIIRLATTMEAKGWRHPTRKDIVHQATFLNFLEWHRDSLPVIVFNEPNHAGEWGGEVNPEDYAEVFDFTASWFHTEPKHYIVMPAGLDAAAPNGPASPIGGSTTMDSFTYLRRMFAAKPELGQKIDALASHAYPNPGFTGSPYDQGKNSLRGFTHELTLFKEFTQKDLDVYITETGWRSTPSVSNKITAYYSYAINNIWNDTKIKAVTPFVYAAASGPFQEFSFTNPDGSPTSQYEIVKQLKNSLNQSLSLNSQ